MSCANRQRATTADSIFRRIAKPLAVVLAFGLLAGIPAKTYAATITKSVAAGSDDAEEAGADATGSLSPGDMDLTSSDIELVTDNDTGGGYSGGTQKIGLRFTAMTIPAGATITNAYLTFRAVSADSPMSNSDATNLTIKGQLIANAPTFTSTNNNISGRTLTTAAAAWVPTSWSTGNDYNSPSIASVIQEIVDQGTWASGNAIAIIITGTGHRASPSYDGDSANAAELVVTYTTDTCPIVTTTADSGEGSFRQCINYANSNPGTTISFNIPSPGNRSSGGDSWWRISPASGLPTIAANGTTIDGTAQTTNQGNTNSRGPEIEIFGAGVGVRGFELTGSNCTVRGLVINSFQGAGMLINTNGGHTVQGNYIGTDATGTANLGNNFHGIYIDDVPNNTIGGPNVADRNVISGNNNDGVLLQNSGATGTVIQGNFIGTDATGTDPLGNGQDGINLALGASGNSIGGTGAGERNIVSANGNDGIELDFSGTANNLIVGNYIGTDVNGTAAGLGNTRFGIVLYDGASSNTIGGIVANAGNVIAGSGNAGIAIDGNGGAATINNLIQGNKIGTNAAGTAGLPNGTGILLFNGAASTTIGGSGANEANTIAFNTSDGVFVDGAGSDDNEISANSIFENGGLGIDLAPDGVGTGSGANQDKAAPTIDSITSGGSGFTVNATVGSGDIVEFFRVNNAAGPAVTPDGTGSGEGFLYLGRCVDNGACSGPHVDAVADADGTNGGVETTILSSGLSGNDDVTATAIDSSGNTSEFASNVQAPVPACVGGLVTTTTDSLDPGTLRSCVIWANNNPGDDTITLPAGIYNLTLGSVGEDLSAEGDLDILGNLTITGAGARTTIIDGASNDRIFDVYDGHVFTISDMTLRNGDALTDGADGGAMDNHSASITITDVTISGNSAKNGGALGSSGGSSSYTLERVTLSGNTAEKSGAIINSSGGDTTTMTNVTITGNTATVDTGAADIDDADLVNVTIVGNTAPPGKIGGVLESGGGFTAINTIIANNIGGDCNSAATSSLNSIDSDGSCGLNTTADPKLNALADNGGPTDTMLPQSDSPAIEGGTNVGAPPIDQRSQPRPDGPLYDVGAVEAVIHELTGTIFEDVNYGGGMGRDLATAAVDAPSFTVGRVGVTVELYNASGTFVSSTATVAGGSYSFNVTPGTYTVRVVNGSVTSSRPGSDGSELAVQTYRIDGVSEAAGDGAKKVGGELPSNEDAAANSGAQTLASLQGTDLDTDGITEWTQSIVTVDASGGDVSGVDFGFNFDVVVNTNDSGQGSLRQFIINSNLLAWLGHGEERLIAAVDSLDRW